MNWLNTGVTRVRSVRVGSDELANGIVRVPPRHMYPMYAFSALIRPPSVASPKLAPHLSASAMILYQSSCTAMLTRGRIFLM